MPNGQPNIPNSNQKTVSALMRVKSFVSPENPDNKQLETFDKEVNDFLQTIDNQKRFLNGRNAYSIGNKTYVLVWYLDKIPEAPVTQPFGDKVKPAEPIMEKNDRDTNTEDKKDK